jgi:hypothetical protein
MSCAQANGSVVTQCPTANLVGCCAVTSSGISVQECFYFGTASADQSSCSASSGTWTNGSSGLGDAGSSSSSGSSSGSSSSSSSGASSSSSSGAGSSSSSGAGCVTGDLGCACYPNSTCNATLACLNGTCVGGTCSASASGPVCCPAGYCTLGSAQGYVFAYSDAASGGSSTASLKSDGSVCVTGKAVGSICADQTCFSTHYGAGMGINVNQAMGTSTPAQNFSPAGSAGVTYALDVFQPNMRLIVGDSTTDYCVVLTSASGMVPWANFNSTCWMPSTGTSLSGPPARFTSVRFQLPADDVSGTTTSFNFCVDKLSF